MLSLLVAIALAASDDVHETAAPVAVPSAERSEGSVGVLAAHFYLPGYRTGEYVSLLPTLRISGVRWWGTLVAPVHYLSYVGSREFGLGDVVAGFGFGALRGENLTLDPGLWTRWPTGDPHQSFGNGHLVISPQLDAQWHAGRWMAKGSLAVRGAIAWGPHGLHRHQPLVDPHDLLDSRLQVELGVALFERLQLLVRVEPVLVFIPHPLSPVGSRVTAGGAAAVTLGPVRLEVGVSMPLTQNRAYDWQLQGAVSVAL